MLQTAYPSFPLQGYERGELYLPPNEADANQASQQKAEPSTKIANDFQKFPSSVGAQSDRGVPHEVKTTIFVAPQPQLPHLPHLQVDELPQTVEQSEFVKSGVIGERLAGSNGQQIQNLEPLNFQVFSR